MASVMVDMKFFRASTVTYASRSARGGLAARDLAHELSKASYTTGGAKVLAAGALSLRVCACVTSLTTIATLPSPQMVQYDFRRNLCNTVDNDMGRRSRLI